MIYRRFIKRILDVLVSTLGLIISCPIILILCILIKFQSKNSGVFFIQQRPGYKEKLFNVIKFKTMTDEKDENGILLSDNMRLTRVGKFIRATSLDELPQLWNVFIGDMSLIGPRPLLKIYLPLYSSYHAKRHDVKPGITGWAQVNGRNLLLLSKKFDYDVWYSQNVSFYLDLKIFLMTVVKIFRSQDVGLGACDMKDVDDLGFSEKLSL